jgi:hypothetical protein
MIMLVAGVLTAVTSAIHVDYGKSIEIRCMGKKSVFSKTLSSKYKNAGTLFLCRKMC